jgi:competence protein ComEC
MMPMRHRPLVILGVAFIAGIGAWLGGIHSLVAVLTVAVAGLGLLMTGGRRWQQTAVGIALTGLAAGALWTAHFQVVAASDVSHWNGGVAPVHLVGTIVTDPDERHGRVTFLVQTTRVQTARRAADVTGEVYVALMPTAAVVMSLDYGDRVALDGHLEVPPDATNPGAFSWRDYLARRGIYSQLRVKRADAVQKIGASALNPYMLLAWTVRRRVLGVVRSALPPVPAAVLSGILLGKRTDLPPDLMADFVHTGTVHILASAGLHVGIVAWWLLFVCERLTLPRKATAWIIILSLGLYDLMAGGRPSVTRAVVMAVIYFGAILAEREPDLPTTLVAAALVILFLQPTALLESGFQLSFLTVLTLAVLMPVWEHFWKPRLEAWIARPPLRRAAYWTLEMLGLSLLAQIGSAPIVALDYNEVSLVGFFANALVVPCLFVLIPVGFLGAALGNLWHPLGVGLLMIDGLGLRFVVWVVRGFGEADWAYRALPSPSPLMAVLYYLAVLGMAAFRPRSQTRSPVPMT